DHDRVNHVVYQAFLATMLLSLVVLAPLGWFAAPWLLDLVRAAPEVKDQALLYLRISFLGCVGMMTFFLLGGALRAAGDAKTPLRAWARCSPLCSSPVWAGGCCSADGSWCTGRNRSRGASRWRR